MRRAISTARKGEWPRSEALGAVTLDFEQRHRRRVRLACDDGGDVLLDLAHAVALRDGDGLCLDGGGWIEVRAAPERLVEIRCERAHDLVRVAWHLGNRHCAAEIGEDRIVMRDDHVLVDMVRRLGARVAKCHGPFDPEGGAYGDHRHGPGDGG